LKALGVYGRNKSAISNRKKYNKINRIQKQVSLLKFADFIGNKFQKFLCFFIKIFVTIPQIWCNEAGTCRQTAENHANTNNGNITKSSSP
jgi:hypothetical protein